MPSQPKSNPKYDFRTCLKKSEVLQPEVLDRWLAENPDQKPKDDASQLVHENLLTQWQAKYLLSGRYRLHLGNYQLLRRVRRDAFGDRFIALHPQLGRTVQVQVLPVELTDNPIQRSEFLEQAGLAGELDHPNLAHVFDIDKQQGRYYLVTEHTPSQSLAELPVETLDANDIARIVRDSIAGLQFAHERSVFHGNLSPENVLIAEDNQVKISQFALSPLVEHPPNTPKENVTPEQRDLLAIVRMGTRVLKNMHASQATRQLTKLLFKLNTKDDEAFASGLVELEDWIKQQSVELGTDTPTASIGSPAVDTESEATELKPENLGHTAPSEATEAIRQKVRTASEDDTQQEVLIQDAKSLAVSDGEIGRLANNARLTEGQKGRRRESTSSVSIAKQYNLRNAGLLASGAVVVALASYFGYRAVRQSPVSNKPSENQTAMRDTGNTASPKRSLIPNRPTADAGSPQPELDSDTNASTDFAARPKPQQNAAPASDTNDFVTSQNNRKPETRQDKTPSKQVTAAKARRFPNPAVSDPFSESRSADVRSDEQPSKDTQASGNPTLTSPPSGSLTKSGEPSVSEIGRVAESPSKPDATTDLGSNASKTTRPLQGITAAFDLPATTSTDEIVLAKLDLNSIHLLGMELRSNEGIGKGRTNFQLQRDETNKQQWSLIARKTARSNGDPVGQFNFDKASREFRFHWLPEAEKSSIANYARNCVIKLTLGDVTWILAMRKPLSLPDLKLTSKEPFAQLDSAIGWLPNPDQLSIELFPTQLAGLPKTWLEPAIAKPGSPLAIHFHEAVSNRFMWLQLNTSFGKATTFDLRLMLKHADGTVQPITRSDDVQKLAELLVQAAKTAEDKYLANVDVVAPYGQKTKFKDYVAKLKSTAKTTLKQSQIAAENVGILDNFYDRVIPLRVMFRADDYEVVLVDTAPNINEDDSKE